MSLLNFRLFCEENGIKKIRLYDRIEYDIAMIVAHPNIMVLNRGGKQKVLYCIKKIEITDVDFEANNNIVGTIYQLSCVQPNQIHKISFVGF